MSEHYKLSRTRLWTYRLVTPLIALIIRLFWMTCRLRIIGEENLDALADKDKPIIPCHWHQRQLFCGYYLLRRLGKRFKMGYLVSPSRDGELVARTLRYLGGRPIRGSATRTGAQAMRNLYRAVKDGFSSDCITVPSPNAQFELLRYEGGHIGFGGVDSSIEDLLNGDFCEAILIWQRILGLLGFLDAHFPDGLYGPGGLQLLGDVIVTNVPSPALSTGSTGIPNRSVVAYRPPAFSNTDEDFPVVYFLGGYGQSPEDFIRVADLMDLLILTGQVQNMFVVFLPGDGGGLGRTTTGVQDWAAGSLYEDD